MADSLCCSNDGKITLIFDTTRFNVRFEDGQFEPSKTVGDVHAMLRKKLVKVSDGGVVVPTYFFLRNATEAFIPAPSQTLGELFEVYGVSKDPRTLAVTIETTLFSG